MLKHTYCALLPMKGHSERVPRKNLRVIAGKPLCHWVLEQLVEIEAITLILVDTDSEELAELVAEVPKCRVVPRPTELCGDFVSMNRVIAHDLSLAPDYSHFLQTHATNPLLSAVTLRHALTRYEVGDVDSVFSVTRHQARFFDAKQKAINHDPALLLRTQDLPPLFEENSNFYIFGRESFSKNQARIGSEPAMVEVPKLEAIDIDEPSDWDLAEALLLQKHQS